MLLSLDRSTLDSLIACDPEWVGIGGVPVSSGSRSWMCLTGAEEEWRYVVVPGDPASLPLGDRPGEPIRPTISMRPFLRRRGEHRWSMAPQSPSIRCGHRGLFAPLASAYGHTRPNREAPTCKSVDPAQTGLPQRAAFAGDGVFLYLPPG